MNAKFLKTKLKTAEDCIGQLSGTVTRLQAENAGLKHELKQKKQVIAVMEEDASFMRSQLMAIKNVVNLTATYRIEG